MNLLILLLIALPMCLAQFSIQGPSDGNRVAQGLRVEEGKGIQYTDQNDSPADGGFSIQGAQNADFNIQGAQDGNSNVQAATDGHSNFQIQGATSGGAESYYHESNPPAYNYQEARRPSQSIIQNTYNENQGSTKSLSYNDPSGLTVNWRSYDRQPRPGPQPEQQYTQAAVASAPRPAPRQRARPRPQPQKQPQLQSPIEAVSLQQMKPLNNAPSYIKDLLQFQAQIPYVNSIPEPLRFDSLLAAQLANEQPQQAQYQDAPQQHAPEPRRPSYRGKPRQHPRERRQAPQHGQGGRQQQQPRRLSQPPADPQVQYNPNPPASIQQLLKFQAQTPYLNVVPEQYRFDVEGATRAQLEQFRTEYPNILRQQQQQQQQQQQAGQAPLRHRQRRQAPYQRQPQPQRPQPEPQPQYSTNLPSHLQQLLKLQAQIPYNIIANQIQYRLDKPYVPQPVQAAAPAQQPQQAQYQGQADSYRGQPSAQNQAYSSRIQYPEYSQYPQGQPGYGQSAGGVRPVTENQY